MNHILRFITGKHSGGEFPLRANREFFIGRGSEFDMVLDDDLVSRRHARITTFGGKAILYDLDSTNGTLVNGELVSEHTLVGGDRVGIGHSIMEFVDASTQEQPAPTPGPPLARVSSSKSTVFKAGLEGAFPGPGTTLADLVKMVANSKKHAVLDLASNTGERIKIYFGEGQIKSARIREPSDLDQVVAAEKSFLRAMSFASGQYKVRGIASDKQFDDVLDDDFDALLKKADEHASQMRKFREVIPDGFPPLQLAKPLEARLAELSDELLDTFQLVINEGEVEAVVNASSASDAETYQDLIFLVQRGYVVPVD